MLNAEVLEIWGMNKQIYDSEKTERGADVVGRRWSEHDTALAYTGEEQRQKRSLPLHPDEFHKEYERGDFMGMVYTYRYWIMGLGLGVVALFVLVKTYPKANVAIGGSDRIEQYLTNIKNKFNF